MYHTAYRLGLYQTGIESIQPNMNSCTNYSTEYEYDYKHVNELTNTWF